MAEQTSLLVDALETHPVRHTLEPVYRERISAEVLTELAADDVFYITTIPHGLRLVGGSLTISAVGAAATASIGDYTYEKDLVEGVWDGTCTWTVGTADKFGSLTDLTLATTQTFGNTAAKGQGTQGIYTTGKETRIGLKIADASVPAGVTITGYIDWSK